MKAIDCTVIRRDTAISLLMGLVVFALFFMDGPAVRWYREIATPAWTGILEDAGSRSVFQWLTPVVLTALLVRGGGAWLRHGLATMAVQWVLVHGIKPVLGRVRPAEAGDAWLWAGPSGVFDGFPSGHAATVWALVFLMWRKWPRGAAAWSTVGLFVCWARVEADAHFVSDIVAGGIIGWAAERAAYAFGRDRRWVLCAEPATGMHTDGEGAWRRQGIWRVAAGVVLPGAVMAGLMRTPIGEGRAEAFGLRDPSVIETQVRNLYLTVLKREPDREGATAYAARLSENPLTIGIIREMMLSGEFAGQVRQMPVPDQVEEVYRRMAARSAKSEEIEWGQTAYARGGNMWGLRAVVLRLQYSREFQELWLCTAKVHGKNGDDGGVKVDR